MNRSPNACRPTESKSLAAPSQNTARICVSRRRTSGGYAPDREQPVYESRLQGNSSLTVRSESKSLAAPSQNTARICVSRRRTSGGYAPDREQPVYESRLQGNSSLTV